MCGIAGIVNFDGAPADPRLLTLMTDALAHRGPDGVGIWTDGHVGLGHRRLAIRDLSDAGAGPMHDLEGPLVVTYNGEIYNDVALRAAIEPLVDARYRSTCDAEVIAPAYRAWGLQALSRLAGMFAFGLWDGRRGEVVLARDPTGIKPLYYAWRGRSLRFASEIKALLALPDQPRQVSPENLHRFLAQGYPGPARTLLQDVFPVPPGSVLVAGPSGARIERYWTPTRSGEIRDMPTALEAFAELFPRVVADTLISDVPVGLLLSSGIDSSLIASALRGRAVPAFTARFDSQDFDESPAARAVSERFGLKHLGIPVDTASEVETRFRRVVHHYDGNYADASAFAFHAVCEAARAHVPVLLTGDGGDEFFGGYETYRATRLAGPIQGLTPRGPTGAAARWLFGLGRSSEKPAASLGKLARFLAGVVHGGGCPHPQWRRHVFPDVLATIAGPALQAVAAHVDPLDEYAGAVQRAAGGLVDRCLVADQAYYLPGDLLVKSDAMSMAHGVEVRVPFLDRRVIEFAGKVHHSLLTPLLGPDKKLLRHALTRAGGDRAIVTAPKRGFNVPVAHHLRHGLRELGTRLLGSSSDALAPYLDPDGVARLWRDHLERRADHGYALWTLLTFAVWQEATRAR